MERIEGPRPSSPFGPWPKEKRVWGVARWVVVHVQEERVGVNGEGRPRGTKDVVGKGDGGREPVMKGRVLEEEMRMVWLPPQDMEMGEVRFGGREVTG